MAKEKTMADIYNEMTPEQQTCVAFYVNQALEIAEKQKLPSALKEQSK